MKYLNSHCLNIFYRFLMGLYSKAYKIAAHATLPKGGLISLKKSKQGDGW